MTILHFNYLPRISNPFISFTAFLASRCLWYSIIAWPLFLPVSESLGNSMWSMSPNGLNHYKLIKWLIEYLSDISFTNLIEFFNQSSNIDLVIIFLFPGSTIITDPWLATQRACTTCLSFILLFLVLWRRCCSVFLCLRSLYHNGLIHQLSSWESHCQKDWLWRVKLYIGDSNIRGLRIVIGWVVDIIGQDDKAFILGGSCTSSKDKPSVSVIYLIRTLSIYRIFDLE